TYIGSNPIADIWCEQAIAWCGTYLRRATYNPLDLEARSYMQLASTFAGIGFGNAGVHIPHAMAYPVAGMVRDYFPPDYNVDEPLVPHGLSVIINAPAAFRYTAPAWPERHMRVAELLGANTAGLPLSAAAELAAEMILGLMKELGIPNGLRELGYEERDVPGLVEGAMKQQRLLVGSPRPVSDAAMATLFREAMQYW
ncbi:MAG: iron-containing alcohol dehydrogenase, partial [Thermomicrobiaceae bacterium]|nr:iron-containing alcohol dehydrogenase [Thermomicrobiaceae bacterium]